MPDIREKKYDMLDLEQKQESSRLAELKKQLENATGNERRNIQEEIRRIEMSMDDYRKHSGIISQTVSTGDKQVVSAQKNAESRYQDLNAFKKLAAIIKGERRRQKQLDEKVEDFQYENQQRFLASKDAWKYKDFCERYTRYYDKLYGGAKKR